MKETSVHNKKEAGKMLKGAVLFILHENVCASRPTFQDKYEYKNHFA
jgi:hypothetical protein